MNNIYKVIWSKAKNCYVVASEIARSHTKSASGSEKIGGVTRRSLLASLMALSLLCGGLGVAEATVHVNEGTGVTSEVYTTGETYSRELVDEKLKSKANANDVATNTANIANLEKNKLSKADASITYATKADVNTELTKKADRTYVDNALNDKADKADVYSKTDAENTFATKTELTAKADATALAGKANTDLSNLTEAGKTAIKTTMTDELAKKADNDTVTVLEGRVGVVEGKVAALETTVSDPSKGLVKKVTDLKTKTTQISFDPAKGTIVNGVDFMAQEVDAHGKGLTGVSTLHTTGDATVGGALTAAGVNAGTEAITGGSLSVTGAVTGSSVNAGSGEIKTDGVVNAGTLRTTSDATVGGAVNAGSLIVENASNLKGDVTMDNNLTVKGDTSLKKTDVDGALTAKGDVTLGTPNGTNTVTVNGTANFQETVKMNNGLNVTNGETNLKKTTVTGDLKVTGTIATDRMIFGDPATNNYTEIDHGKVTSTNLEVRAGEMISSSSTFDVEKNEVGFGNGITDEQSSHKQTSDVITDTVKNNNTGDQSFHKQTSDVIMDNVKDGKNSNNRTQTKTETKDIITDENGNSSTTSQTASENKTYLKDKDGKNTNSTIDTAKGYDKTIKGENGKTSTKQDELNITNTAKDGTITNDAKNIVNNAATMDTTVTGKATESYGELETTVNGKETHNVTGTKTENVTGKVTENYNGGQETNVTGNQDIHVTKNQTNKIDGDQVNIIGGSQTTTATDINRNASSGMIDTVENASGSNKETKVAGQTTTDVKLASGEEGHYIRGATESRDYLLNGTLKNSETKTAEATSSEVTDGTNKASTIQDAKNLAGSVTNGTETGISGIHANKDGSVSIDSTVVVGGMSSVINQKKDSIQSAVGDGTSSTVIRQDKDNVAIASSNGTVAIGGKDIVNNASNSITDKVGDNTRVTTSTSITDTVGTANRKIENGKIIDTADDSTVTTENGKGTTFTKTGSTAYSTAADAPMDTNIAGNHITTGRVDANELGVSDKDGDNSADLSVKAGEGVKASASNGTITGSLDVTADEVGSSVKDASGKGSTFKQRIDAIMMESKNVSITAEGTLTKEAKDIVTNASNSITEKVGDTNVTEKTTTSSKSEIQNADTITSVQQTESMVQSYVGKKDGSATNVTTNFANASANQVTENGQTSTVLNNKDGLLIQNNANGNSFTTADGTNTGPALEWTNIKGNEISTGKVEANYVKMGYADVMKDLGVRGNANITGKTTTGSLEVTGTSTLKGDVTMGSNATVKKDLIVEGTTTTKTLKVTENATVGGTLDVAKKATFQDSVDIAKDLSVGGDVTAKSYKVGDKTYISAAGINANDQKITNVADGSISEGSKDAVNGGQLYQVKNDLEGKVNKVGANAAAMANLHPMEFDPDSKWNIAAAMGNYGSETAAALGAFYRPNEDVMVNFSTAFGTGENMVGGGVSVRLGKGGNKLSREETNALKDQVDDLTARMDALLSVLNPNMSKDFPDVPENHWAYEAVSRLAGNDIVQGYPDGEFHGERTMTRYEMAEIIYNALSRGAEAEKELVEEFKPELQAMAASEKATAERAEG